MVLEIFLHLLMGVDFSWALEVSYRSVFQPLDALRWMEYAEIVVPLTLVFFVLSSFIKHVLARRVVFQVLSIVWVGFGFLSLAIAY